MTQPDASLLTHWADHAAARTLAAHPDQDTIVVAAGITPSGVVHVGNFREVITVDLVARALRDRGKKVRFVYSWDDFDVFRKVPAGMPEPDMLQANLGRSIVDVPDPYGCHDSYAAHNIATFEQSLEPLAIRPEFIRQHAMYRSGAYAEGIRAALVHRDEIRRILNDAREQHGARTRLGEDWLPLAGFCGACGRDELDLSWDGEWTVQVHCRSCGHDEAVDLREGGNLKLPWRVDWPMRWAHEKVCFEPGGKDHSSAGGSYDTARHIVAQVYGWVAPQYVGYDFVRVKGAEGKISSSRGGVVTVADCLEIYEPEVLRWLFASYRPNTEFQISFDLDVLKIYEDHDRAVRLAHQADDGGRGDKKRRVARRTVQLASLDHAPIEPGSAPPYLPAFRPLSVVVQIFDGDVDAARRYYERAGELPDDPRAHARFEARARCVWRWLERYAPDDFRYRIRTEPARATIPAGHTERFVALCAHVEQLGQASDQQWSDALRALARADGPPIKEFYPLVYDLLIARDRGPKLSTLLAAMGPERALPLLRPSLPQDSQA